MEDDDNLQFYEKQIKKNSHGALLLELKANLDRLPPVISELTQITELHICNSNLASLPSDLKKLINLKTLKLRGNEFKDLPASVCGINSLQELDLAINFISHLPEDILALKQLKVLNLENNCLDASQIGQLGKLEHLVALNLSSNKLRCVPDNIGNLAALRILILKHNHLTTAPAFLKRLHNLQELNISYNLLSQFKVDLTSLSKLRNLDLGGNMLEEFPDSILALTNIERLDVAKNKIKAVPPFIVNLHHLKEIWLEKNQLAQFPGVLCDVSSLETISLSGNNFKTVHENIQKLQNLRYLDLGDCGIEDFPETICALRNLRWLCLNENHISSLPYELTCLRSLLFIYLNENPMKTPPLSVCQRGVQAVFNYLKETHKRRALHQKIVITGSVGAGKSSLARSLVRNCSVLTDETERTVILDRLPWTPETDLNIQLYDFGGHTWYQVVQPFFLDKSAIIVLVVNLATYQRSEYEEHVGCWLSLMQARAPGATVKMVGTNIDRCSTDEASEKVASILEEMRIKENLEVELLKKAIAKGGKSLEEAQTSSLCSSLERRIVLPEKMHLVSSKTLENFHALKTEILIAARQQGKVIPASWQNLLDTINLSALNNKEKKFLTLNDILHMESKDQSQKVIATIEYQEPQQYKGEEKKETTATQSNLIKTSSTALDHEKLESQTHSQRKDEVTRKLSATTRFDPGTCLKDVLSFFHSIGELLWFEHNRAISEFVFHQQEHLISLLKAIFSHNIEENIINHNFVFLKQQFTKQSLEQAKQDLLQRGIMSSSLLKGLWEYLNLAPEMFSAMTELLAQFDLCYPMMVDEENEVISWRFPFFIKEDPSLIENLCQVRDAYRLTLEFMFLLRCPTSVYEKTSVRFYKHINDINSIHHCRLGMMAHVLSSRIVLFQYKQENDVLSLSVEGTQIGELWTLLLRLLKEVQVVLQQWPGVGYEMWFVCPQCMKKGDLESAYRFPGGCIDKVYPVAEQYMTCPKENAPVPKHLLSPEKGKR